MYDYNELNGEDGLRKTLNERIPLDFMRRCYQHCLRYMHYYRMGLVGHELEFAVKKYKTHRPIDAEQQRIIKAEFEKYSARKSK